MGLQAKSILIWTKQSRHRPLLRLPHHPSSSGSTCQDRWARPALNLFIMSSLKRKQTLVYIFHIQLIPIMVLWRHKQVQTPPERSDQTINLMSRRVREARTMLVNRQSEAEQSLFSWGLVVNEEVLRSRIRRLLLWNIGIVSFWSISWTPLEMSGKGGAMFSCLGVVTRPISFSPLLRMTWCGPDGNNGLVLFVQIIR